MLEKYTMQSLPFKRQPRKMVKPTQTGRVFDHFVGLAIKGLREIIKD